MSDVIMKKKKCYHCGQLHDGTIENFMELKPCNAADGDGHCWIYNTARFYPFTEKYPFEYEVSVIGYTATTTNKDKWIKLQKQLEEKNIFEFDPKMIAKLQVAGFTVERRYK